MAYLFYMLTSPKLFWDNIVHLFKKEPVNEQQKKHIEHLKETL